MAFSGFIKSQRKAMHRRDRKEENKIEELKKTRGRPKKRRKRKTMGTKIQRKRELDRERERERERGNSKHQRSLVHMLSLQASIFRKL